MKAVVKLEELTMFLGSAFILYRMDVQWWYYLLLLLGPDISMLGYLAGNKAGAVSYNLFHHKGIACLVFFIGLLTDNLVLGSVGVILFGHSSMDRFFGYGLKYFEGFQSTHLGRIGKNNPADAHQHESIHNS